MIFLKFSAIIWAFWPWVWAKICKNSSPVSYTPLRAPETPEQPVWRPLLAKKTQRAKGDVSKGVHTNRM